MPVNDVVTVDKEFTDFVKNRPFYCTYNSY
jgi:hypothetical protein